MLDVSMSAVKWTKQDNILSCNELKMHPEYSDIYGIACDEKSSYLLVLKPKRKNFTDDEILLKVSNGKYVNDNILIAGDKNGITWFAIGKSVCGIKL